MHSLFDLLSEFLGLSRRLGQSCVREHSDYRGHRGHPGEQVRNSLLFVQRVHSAQRAPSDSESPWRGMAHKGWHAPLSLAVCRPASRTVAVPRPCTRKLSRGRALPPVRWLFAFYCALVRRTTESREPAKPCTPKRSGSGQGATACHGAKARSRL